MLLERDETILFTDHEVTVDERTGSLYLTNRRLIFEIQTATKSVFGSKKKKQSTIYEEIKLSDLTEVLVDNSSNSHKLRIATSKEAIKVETSEPDRLKGYILRAKVYKGNHSGFLGGSTVERVKCKYCGLMVNSDLQKCSSCGAPLDQ